MDYQQIIPEAGSKCDYLTNKPETETYTSKQLKLYFVEQKKYI